MVGILYSLLKLFYLLSDLTLLLLGGVILGILAEVAQFSCVLKLLCNVVAQINDKIIQTLFKFFKTFLG